MHTELLSFILVMIFAAGVIIYLMIVQAFFRRLDEAHSDVWEFLGKPKFGFQLGDPRYRNAMNYIRKRGFSNLNDDILQAKYRQLKWLEYGALIVVGLLLILAF